ncbi:MAG: hypothetical protein IKM97_04930 [Clostridia bacterium]|nr:hypothetical protein [Clostridia bacterium]
MNDVSSSFKYNFQDKLIAIQLVKREETPEAIKYFSENCDKLTNYGYWFLLSTLWVSYTGHSDIELWKKLFSSNRPQKLKSIMKPSELKEFNYLPYIVTVYRAKRPNEKQWIAYTLDFEIAKRFAKERNVNKITKYEVKKKDILALFLRRGEKEIIVLDENKPKFIEEIEVG